MWPSAICTSQRHGSLTPGVSDKCRLGGYRPMPLPKTLLCSLQGPRIAKLSCLLSVSIYVGAGTYGSRLGLGRPRRWSIWATDPRRWVEIHHREGSITGQFLARTCTNPGRGRSFTQQAEHLNSTNLSPSNALTTIWGATRRQHPCLRGSLARSQVTALLSAPSAQRNTPRILTNIPRHYCKYAVCL